MVQKDSLKRLTVFYVLLLGAVIFFLFGVYGIKWYYHYKSLEDQYISSLNVIRQADMLDDDEEAIRLYQGLPLLLPGVQLRILQRKWSMAIDLLHQVNLAKSIHGFQEDVPRLFERLHENLDEMREKCGVLLQEQGSIEKEIIWKTFNLRGAIRLLTAFLVLETEENMPKAVKIMKEAVSDFKAAISAVDTLPASTIEKNIPRWNLELLYTKQHAQKMNSVKAESMHRMDLRENLEALIPEKGGYAAGEPIERKIKK